MINMSEPKTKIISKVDLLMKSLSKFYAIETNISILLPIVQGTSKISLRVLDWFVTNYAKKYYTVYEQTSGTENMQTITRFKVYNDYKLKLKAYSKKRFDPFCRWDRVSIPYDNEKHMETTIGQLNFFKWAIENQVLEYIEKNYDEIETDMNSRNSISKKNVEELDTDNKTRKKREELSVSACKTIKKESVKIVVKFN